MKQKTFRRFYILSLFCILIASVYPLYMGIRVVSDMLRFGTVYAESYPKYVIPYTPISIAMVVGIALMPLLLQRAKKPLPVISAVCIAIFFAVEWMLEKMVIVTTTIYETVPNAELEAWQMFMCISPSWEIRTVTEVDILMGQYSPAFKLHFYLISVILILTLLNSFYGFGRILQSGDKTRQNALVLQSVSASVFLGLCIFACFTAFYRTGTILVSPISAVLMCLFFIVFGVTAGIYVGSFLLGRGRTLSIVIPAFASGGISAAMYIGELILLNGNLYRFGSGLMFDGIIGIVLAPVDLLVILLSAVVAAGIMNWLNGKQSPIISLTGTKNPH